jgi:N-acetylglutamate synthase-like GNAT family acetyltransferase
VQLQVEPARAYHLAPALELLSAAGLPTHGVTERFGHFVVICDDARVIAVAGLEVCGAVAVLRSVVVESTYRGEGLGNELIQGVEKLAARLAIECLYCNARSARGFFAKNGFVDCVADDVPLSILTTTDLHATTQHTLMKKTLK